MNESKEPTGDADAFVDVSPAPKKTSKFAVIRQVILGFLLFLALCGLGWEYLIAKPNYQRARSNLETLAEEFPQSKGIEEKFLQSKVNDMIGFEAQEVRPIAGGDAEIHIYRWRRVNIMNPYVLAVKFKKVSLEGTTQLVYSDWYADLEELPADVPIPPPVADDELPGDPSAAGGPTMGRGRGRPGDSNDIDGDGEPDDAGTDNPSSDSDEGEGN